MRAGLEEVAGRGRDGLNVVVDRIERKWTL